MNHGCFEYHIHVCTAVGDFKAFSFLLYSRSRHPIEHNPTTPASLNNPAEYVASAAGCVYTENPSSIMRMRSILLLTLLQQAERAKGRAFTNSCYLVTVVAELSQ